MSAHPSQPLPTHEVCDVWSIDLGPAASAATRLEVLNSQEQQRATRLRVERDRERFATCRAALRRILGRYLDEDPAGLIFESGEHGKPSLPRAPFDFNVSHSADLALLIVGTPGPIGVDLEAWREVIDPLELAARYFHAEERECVEAAAAPDRHAVFLTCWTRKEAVLKSIGVGLTLDPRRIRVGATVAERSVRLAWRDERHELLIRSFEPARGYVGACVTAMTVQQIRFREFEPAAG